MNKFLIATHGALASGILSTIEIIIGNNKNIEYIDAFTEGTDLVKELGTFIQEIDENDVGVIFTDLRGGSVNQKAFNMVGNADKKNIFVVTGFNLALILSLVLKPNRIVKEEIDTEIKVAREQMQLLEVESEDSAEIQNGFFN
ncbi:PTS sugar transporter subunit IIA [Pediococcus pentosaceus]|uniref:PTS mannose transporter subunit IIA n=1 Tax=Pediococcus pentosaceus TaxID=1255 RepID=A0ABQ6XGR5_PEDPE|nr:PTS mannose transporter subunit IIA [Pediococcus pentosaceus]KAF0412468.1 PTS mannose transporter subunit IIA [Pediococcus pentosaceus]KAF0501458.1 PTS mannose transporter subunit IIA [Pediococcus pentosaceus]